jgi:NAD(P)-dependent dehydrogenase (short-subunit alcohol dehydrogenase family)
MIPLRRQGSAEEAAGALLMLASPYSSYITGQVSSFEYFIQRQQPWGTL